MICEFKLIVHDILKLLLENTKTSILFIDESF